MTPTSHLDVSPAGLRTQVERRLQELVPRPDGEPLGVAAAAHSSVLGGGKRLRPLLLLLAGQALGCRSPGLLDLACAVEMVHCASLVLDDMPSMDNAALRRGQPTVHLRYGEDVAMLTAVALVSEACRVAACAPSLGGAVRARVVQVLCEAIGPMGLVGGQYRDLRDAPGARTASAVAEANDQKTGVLFAAVLEIAARASGRAGEVRALRRAGYAIGQAFQLRDDLEDAVPGLAPAEDAGKDTLVHLLGAPAVRGLVHAHLLDALRWLRTALGHEDPRLTELLRAAFADARPQDDLVAPMRTPLRLAPAKADASLAAPG